MAASPAHLLIVDIDGLRPDVFAGALSEGYLPHLERLLGGPGLERGTLLPVLAPAPSITFASQACLFTGEHPRRHGVVGNQFFDRFGTSNGGSPRQYSFDVGDTLDVDDAVNVFRAGLASGCLQVPTLYERLAGRGLGNSVVVGHMYARGAETWLPPSLLNLARFTKGGNLFGLSAPDFDRDLLKKALDYLDDYGLPQVLTVYFMGVDHDSHHHGPAIQAETLITHIDPLIGELWEAVASFSPATLCVLCSDHGQIGVPADDLHSLRLAFPFERELGPLFDVLNLDVHDFPGEDPHSDAVVASNGGLAHVYLRSMQSGRWADPPNFEQEVLQVGGAFWAGHATGRYAADLEGALAGVLVRDAAQEGWEAPFRALTQQGELRSLAEWFVGQPAALYADPVHRLENLAGPQAGDLLLISNYAEGFYFGGQVSGVHGGLHPEDSYALLAYGWPGAAEAEWEAARAAIEGAIIARCRAEDGRYPSTADMVTGLLTVLNL